MNRRTFLRGAALVATGLGISAVATVPEAPVTASTPMPPQSQAKVTVPFPGSISIEPNTVTIFPGKPIQLADGSWVLEDNYNIKVAQQYAELYKQRLIPYRMFVEKAFVYENPESVFRNFTDWYIDTPEGKAEIAALAKEMLSSV